ncbi:MAG: PLP-dependent transferase, partial [Alphaproteobacteria bacterium]|nr:PLP-dependent transferase [Alphaproteobacteria bacterium]
MTKLHAHTLLVTEGREPEKHFGTVNPPIHQASTIIFQTLDDLEAAYKGQYKPSSYGLFGVPVTHYLQDALASLDGAEEAILFPSGLKAITVALRALLAPGDHLLMVDTVYGPTREFCDAVLAPLGVETTYYDALIGEGI